MLFNLKLPTTWPALPRQSRRVGISRQLSAVSCQPSAFSRQPSAEERMAHVHGIIVIGDIVGAKNLSPYRRRPPGWTARAMSYRHEHAIAQEAAAMAVVVQVMVELYPRVESKEGRKQ